MVWQITYDSDTLDGFAYSNEIDTNEFLDKLQKYNEAVRKHNEENGLRSAATNVLVVTLCNRQFITKCFLELEGH